MSDDTPSEPTTAELLAAATKDRDAALKRVVALEESNGALTRELGSIHTQISAHQDEATRATQAHAELRDEQRGIAAVFDQATGRAAGLAAEVAGLRSDLEGRGVEADTWKARHADVIVQRDGARATIEQLEKDAASDRRDALNAIEEIRGERDGVRAELRAAQDELQREKTAHAETAHNLLEASKADAAT